MPQHSILAPWAMGHGPPRPGLARAAPLLSWASWTGAFALRFCSFGSGGGGQEKERKGAVGCFNFLEAPPRRAFANVRERWAGRGLGQAKNGEATASVCSLVVHVVPRYLRYGA